MLTRFPFQQKPSASFNPTFSIVDGLFFINGHPGISGFKDSATGVCENAFAANAEKPSWIHPTKKPVRKEGKVTVSCFINGWCPAMSLSCERVKRAAAEPGDKVVVEQYETLNPGTFREWGISDALYIDGKSVGNGPPPSFKKIKSKVEARVRRLKQGLVFKTS